MKRKPTDAVLFANLQQEMKKRHLSHEDIAHRSGFAVSTVRKMFTDPAGCEDMTLDKLDRIARALGVSSAQLLSESGEAPAVAGGAPSAAPAMYGRASLRGAEAMPRQLGRLIEEFFLLPEADRKALLSHASDMASKYRMHAMR